MTVSKAYAELEREGVVERRPGRPHVVAARPATEACRDREQELARALAPAGDAAVAVVPWESPARLLQALASAASAPAKADLLLGAPPAHVLEHRPARAAVFAEQLVATLANTRSAAFGDALVAVAQHAGSGGAVAREQLLHACLHAPGRPLHPDAAVGALCAALGGEYVPL